MDPKVMRAIAARIPPNPQSGKAELMDIMKYMEENPTELDSLLDEVSKQKYAVDLTTYNYNALAPSIIHESFWVLQLEPMGFEDEAGNPVDPSQAHNARGVKPTFIIYCYDDKGTYRLTQECKGLPDSKTVLEAIQHSIVEPLPPLKPVLPWFLLVSIKFSPHVDSLKPFLDSLPAPFHWRLESRAEAEGVHDGVADLNEKGVKSSMEYAEKAKATGNRAFSAKDRKAAIKAYTEGLGHALDALSQKPEPEDEKKAARLRAICYGNRSAAYLMPGGGINLKKALDDGKAAEFSDPSYAKAYIRQATASQMLGNTDEAQDTIARALRRKDLENDSGLVDRLIDLTTEGNGLSDSEGVFKNWMLDISINDRKSSERLRGIGGEWRRRLAAQFEKWPRKDSS